MVLASLLRSCHVVRLFKIFGIPLRITGPHFTPKKRCVFVSVVSLGQMYSQSKGSFPLNELVQETHDPANWSYISLKPSAVS